MPDVQQGLSGAPEDTNDPNTESGFEAALAKAVGREAPAATEDAPEAGLAPGIAEGLETAEESAPQQQRDEAGRFVRQPDESEAEEEGVAPEASEESGTEGEVSDPELESLLARHDGDVNAALVALVEERRNRESVIGRQGTELGELRQRLEALERDRQTPQQPQQQIAPPPSRDELGAAIEEYGFETVMGDIIERYPDQIDTVIELGYDYDERAARRFERAYLRNLATTPPPTDPRVEEMAQARSLAQTVTAELGAYDAKLHTAIQKEIPNAMQNIGPLLQRGLLSSDPTEKAEAVRFILRDAAGRVQSTASAQATRVNEERSKAKAEEKRRTAVATGSLRPVREGQAGGELTSEERQRIFREQLLSTETTSVQEGYTYGDK